MKVAYNNVHSLFSLSALAETEYRRKKGIELFWYEPVGSKPNTRYKKIPDITKFGPEPKTLMGSGLQASFTDLGDDVEEIPTDSHFFYCWWPATENRTDPDLIEVIERLGERANGSFSSIKIAEIPDGARFEIIEYDGLEEVVPPRMSWSDAIG